MLEDQVEENKQEVFKHKKDIGKSKILEKDLRKVEESVCVQCDQFSRKVCTQK